MTAQAVGYQLVRDSDGEVIAQWGGVWGTMVSVPDTIVLPNGDHVCGASVGESYGGCTLRLWEMEEPAPPVPPVVSDRQFAQALKMGGYITHAEALAFVRTGEIPASLSTVVEAIQDQEQREAAELLLSGATQFERGHSMTLALASAMGWDDEQLDQLWRLAGSL